MQRIFPDVFEVYDQLGSYISFDDFLEDKLYQEYVNRLPTIQEYYRRISNKKAITGYIDGMNFVNFIKNIKPVA